METNGCPTTAMLLISSAGVVQAHPARAFEPFYMWCDLPAASHALLSS